MKLEPRTRLLLALLVVLVAVAAWRLSGGFGAGSGGVFGRARPPIDLSSSLAREIVDLKVERLMQSTGEYRPGRNPFAYAERKPPPRPVPREVERPKVEQAPPPVVATATDEPPRPRPPPLDVKYIGRFGPRRRPIAVFEDQEKALINAFEGDVLNGKFRVEEIGLESVDLSFVGFPDEPATTLAITGSEG